MALEYGAGIFKSLLSGLQRKPKSDKPVYSAWCIDVQLRVDALLHVLAAVIGVNGAPRINEQPGQLKKISTSLQEIDSQLCIEDFEVRIVSCSRVRRIGPLSTPIAKRQHF
jgi:hypothetical protein